MSIPFVRNQVTAALEESRRGARVNNLKNVSLDCGRVYYAQRVSNRNNLKNVSLDFITRIDV